MSYTSTDLVSAGVLASMLARYDATRGAAATTEAQGQMSAADKAKLDGIAAGANNYTLPTMGADTLGGAKLGSGLAIDENGVLSVSYGSADSTSY